jgi:hypothetical protein
MAEDIRDHEYFMRKALDMVRNIVFLPVPENGFA